jgi:hypothetical protein
VIPAAAGVVAAGLAVAAYFGGLAEAPKPTPEPLGKGAMLDQTRISTEFDDAVIRAGRVNGIGVSDKRYLQILLKVTNQADTTISAFEVVDDAFPSVRADGKTIKSARQGVLDGPRIVALVNGKPGDQLQPRVPTTVIMSFELPPGQAPPKKVELDAGTFILHEDFFYQTHDWLVDTKEVPLTAEDRKLHKPLSSVPVVKARVSLPVRVEASR